MLLLNPLADLVSRRSLSFHLKAVVLNVEEKEQKQEEEEGKMVMSGEQEMLWQL